MSAIAYGRLVRQSQADHPEIRSLDPIRRLTDDEQGQVTEKVDEENKLVTQVAALIPVEILALHALVLAQSTTIDDEGATSITSPGVLKWSLLVLAATATIAYVIGRGTKGWTKIETIRAAIPAFAFVAWTGIVGTSALSPWVAGAPQAAVVLGAGVLAVLLIATNTRINPPK